MFDFLSWEDALRRISSGESWSICGELVCVGYEVQLVTLGLGALVSGIDDVP